MTDQDRRFRRAITGWLRRNTIGFAVCTALAYLLLIPVSIWLFPDSGLVTTVLVLVTGFTSSVATLGSLLVQLEDE